MSSPLVLSMAKKGSWVELVDSMKKRLPKWTFISLNLPSRLVLVKSVLQAIRTYLFSTLASLNSILKEIRNSQSKFMWSGAINDHKWDLVKWDIVCTQKNQGGLRN